MVVHGEPVREEHRGYEDSASGVQSIARARAANKEEAEANLICKTPFDPQHQLMRKEAGDVVGEDERGA